LHHPEDPRRTVGDAEVITTALIAASYFHGHWERACVLVKRLGYFPHMLSVSRFNRRVHAVADLVVTFLMVLGDHAKHLTSKLIYALDSFPIPVCQNIRIGRCRLYRDPRYRGYIPSKRTYFYGVNLHLMITEYGHPIEVFLTPGSVTDVETLPLYRFDLPEGATVYADRGYTHYAIEDELREMAAIDLTPMRKKNSQRPFSGPVQFAQMIYRKRVETAGSMINALFPKHIHAVTPQGFELKIFLFVLAYAFDRYGLAT